MPWSLLLNYSDEMNNINSRIAVFINGERCLFFPGTFHIQSNMIFLPVLINDVPCLLSFHKDKDISYILDSI